MLSLIVYLAVAVILWPQLYKIVYRHHWRTWPNNGWTNGDRAFVVIWGGFICICWPIFLPIALIIGAVYWLGNHGAFKALEKLEN